MWLSSELPPSLLRGIGISCKLVDDNALAALPRFPALRQFVSIDVSDDGFRHIGVSENLESLYCMYCRDTGDAATEHLRGLRKLRDYYAGMTQITDRSLEILGKMEAFEKLEFWQCMSITDAGVAHLAALPKLQRIEIHGSPRVSRGITQLFRRRYRRALLRLNPNREPDIKASYARVYSRPPRSPFHRG